MSESGIGWPVYERLARADPSRLTTPERMLVAFGGVREAVNNGGFDQYFFNSAGDLAMEAVEASVRAGELELADLLRRALAVLGDGVYSNDRDARQRAFVGVIDPEAFQGLDEEFFRLEERRNLDAAMDLLAGGT
ncbi:MAG TPA: DUF4375 domain-containing protein [Acidimicrobiales bacterium]|nr:DUF4375 domain-containing protein [Acidimicrobiales bacterium]